MTSIRRGLLIALHHYADRSQTLLTLGVEWSGEFEHQVRAARTLRFVFPAVIVLIFIILYMTYKDLADALLMMLAVPQGASGRACFMNSPRACTAGQHHRWISPSALMK